MRDDVGRLRAPGAARPAFAACSCAATRRAAAVARRRLHLHLRRRVPHLGGGRRRRSPSPACSPASLGPRHPAHLRRARRRDRRAGGRRQHRDRGSAARRRLQRRGRRLAHRPALRWAWSAAMVAGMLVACVLAAFAIKYLVDQVIVGVVLNVLVIGLTSFFYSQVLQPNAAAAQHAAAVRPRIPIPLLSEIPVHRPGLLPPDDHRLPDVHRGRASCGSACSAPGGVCACAPWASTRRPPTPWASR